MCNVTHSCVTRCITGIFLSLVYARGLTWDFSAEVTAIIATVLGMTVVSHLFFFPVFFRNTHKVSKSQPSFPHSLAITVVRLFFLLVYCLLYDFRANIKCQSHGHCHYSQNDCCETLYFYFPVFFCFFSNAHKVPKLRPSLLLSLE